MTDDNTLVPSVIKDETLAVSEYSGYGGPETHDVAPIGMPILRWRHMGANTASAQGGKYYNSLEGEDAAYDEVPCIILDGKNSRAYYDRPYDPKAAKAGVSSMPDCKSNDGIEGVGTPGGKCELCPLSKWGAAGEPPRCALSYDRLIFDFHTHQLGIISFARTKIKAIQDFQRTIKARNGGTVPMWAYKVVLRSERKENFFIPRIDIEGVLPKGDALKFMELKAEANNVFLRSNTSDSFTPNAVNPVTGKEELDDATLSAAY